MKAGKEPRIAAFFDIDGTLVPRPSLEWRLFRLLRYQRAIRAVNCLWWLAEMIRLLPRGIPAIQHINKTYLRGVRAEAVEDASRKSMPAFFPAALERAAWHAAQGHAIVLVSGTLEPLANNLAHVLEAKLHARGYDSEVSVCATCIEEPDGRYTGRILGEPMFGEAKRRAAHRLAAMHGFSLADSYAYGDALSDRWLLAAVGHPVAVNPSPRLASVAANHGWAVVH